ncbi:hypothetical protein C0993_012404, partial [Termitomyces sp. T159_Od127]
RDLQEQEQRLWHEQQVSSVQAAAGVQQILEERDHLHAQSLQSKIEGLQAEHQHQITAYTQAKE